MDKSCITFWIIATHGLVNIYKYAVVNFQLRSLMSPIIFESCIRFWVICEFIIRNSPTEWRGVLPINEPYTKGSDVIWICEYCTNAPWVQKTGSRCSSQRLKENGDDRVPCNPIGRTRRRIQNILEDCDPILVAESTQGRQRSGNDMCPLHSWQ